jgi:hypothetical protein
LGGGIARGSKGQRNQKDKVERLCHSSRKRSQMAWNSSTMEKNAWSKERGEVQTARLPLDDLAALLIDHLHTTAHLYLPSTSTSPYKVHLFSHPSEQKV